MEEGRKYGGVKAGGATDCGVDWHDELVLQPGFWRLPAWELDQSRKSGRTQARISRNVRQCSLQQPPRTCIPSAKAISTSHQKRRLHRSPCLALRAVPFAHCRKLLFFPGPITITSLNIPPFSNVGYVVQTDLILKTTSHLEHTYQQYSPNLRYSSGPTKPALALAF